MTVFFSSEMNMGIKVQDLHESGDEAMVPNPVQTFEQAFAHHRMYNSYSEICIYCYSVNRLPEIIKATRKIKNGS